jgi:stearoyl-CoA desaturase (delta-9 desaturase)
MAERQKDWINIVFLSLTPVIGVLGTAVYAAVFGVRWWEPVLFLSLFGVVSFSVTAGYHRCFSHRAYTCHPAVQAFYLFFGAMALQNSALKWSSDHRDHHRYVDRSWDPYDIRRGGLWAHILWLFYREAPSKVYENVPDLKSNRLVRWQFRLNNWIGIIAGLGLPTLVGALFGRPLGGLLWGGFLRIVVIHHTTFLVNSVAHLYGSRPYTEENSARDNALLAFLTNGEGYHNFHHKFPSDFRNGARWYQWDPTKWLIGILERAGLARNLRRTPRAVVEKARMRVRLARAEARLPQMPGELAESFRRSVDAIRRSLDRAVELWHEYETTRRSAAAKRERAPGFARSARSMLRESRASLRAARQEWRAAAQMLSRVPQDT